MPEHGACSPERNASLTAVTLSDFSVTLPIVCWVRHRGAPHGRSVAPSVDPQPHFIFHHESLPAIRRKSGLQLESMGFERHVEAPARSHKRAYEQLRVA